MLMSNKNLIYGVLFLMLFNVSVAMAKPVKKRNVAQAANQTVCTVTINSDDEKKLFTDYLSKDSRYKFQELVTGQDNWFDEACKSGVKCDVVVISGHFAGSFFGSSGKYLSLSELESKSCSRKCGGILENPKEIYLFGCNTLADKSPDSRTPDQYYRVLTEEEGMTRDTARRIVESRYGAAGEDNVNRMRRVFAGVPAIYGFSSKAPLGVDTKPVLNKHLQQVSEGFFSHINDLEQAKSRQPYTVESLAAIKNKNLFELYGAYYKSKGRPNCFTQTAGIDSRDDVADRICKIRNSNNPISARAANLAVLMNSDTRLSYIELCNDFFNEISLKKLSPEENIAVNAIRNNEKLKDELVKVVGNLSFFLGYQYGSLAIQLGAPRSVIVPILSKAFANTMNDGGTLEEYDVIRSLARFNTFHENLNLKFEDFKQDVVWKSAFAVASIGLTETKNELIIEKIISLLSTGDKTVQSQAAIAIGDLKISNPTAIEKLISGLNNPNYFVRINIINSLNYLNVENASVVQAGLKTLKSDPNDEVRAAAIVLVSKFKTAGENGLVQLGESLKDSSWKVRKNAADFLSRVEIKNMTILSYLIDGLADDNFYVKMSCESALRKNKNNLNDELKSKLKSKFPEVHKKL